MGGEFVEILAVLNPLIRDGVHAGVGGSVGLEEPLQNFIREVKDWEFVGIYPGHKKAAREDSAMNVHY